MTTSWYVGLGAAAAATFAVSGGLMGGPLRVMKARGAGIVPFELAGSDRRGREILAAWGEDGTAAARRSLYLDFPFLVGYAGLGATLAAASAQPLGDAAGSWLAGAGWGMAGAAVVAGLADAVEDVALLRAISRSDDAGADLGPQLRVARRAAQVKFGLIAAVGVWLVVAGGVLLLDEIN